MGCGISKSGRHQKKKHHLDFIVERHKSVEADYKIIEKIGKGSIGVIYRAESRRPTFYNEDISLKGAAQSTHRGFPGASSAARSSTTQAKQQYAIKEIDTNMIDIRALESLKTEIRILKKLDHPFIIKFFGSYSSVTEHREKFSVCMELCTGGTLDKSVPYRESVAKVLVANILEAVLYLHKHHVIHRDLKVRLKVSQQCLVSSSCLPSSHSSPFA